MSNPAYASTRPSATVRVFAILALVLAAVAIYFFATRTPSEKRLKLALVTWTQDPFWEPLIRGAQDSARRSNVELTVIRSEPTVEAQNKHIRDQLSAGVDGIAISPNNASEQQAILDEAAGKVKVVTFDSDAPDSKRVRFVGIDNYAAGHTCADEIREAMPDGGPVLISVGSATMQHGRDRRQGVIDGLLERGFDRSRAPDPLDAPLAGSKYTVVTTVTDGGDPATAVKAIAEALKAHPEVKGIVGLFSYSAPSALKAMAEAGRAGTIKVVGFDDAEETQTAIADGSIHASVLQDSYRAGFESIHVLANEVRGVERGPAEQSPTLIVGINVLASDNLDRLREAGSIRPVAASPTTVPSN